MVQPNAEVFAKNEEKIRKKKRSPNSSDAPAEAKKKRIVVRVRKSTKKSTQAKVSDPDSLYLLKDYPEDDDMEFVAHKPTDAAPEMVVSEGDDCKAKPLQLGAQGRTCG